MLISLDYITHQPKQPAQGSVIWLHGLGADGHDFADIVPQLALPQELSLRFLFPHAPIRPITINANMQMRAWYDIYSLENLHHEDKLGIQQSQQLVEQLIQSEIERGIPSTHIILAGFSQGGAISLHTGLRYSQPLGGIVALSTYLPCQDNIQSQCHSANGQIPIFMAHGSLDPLLPIELAETSARTLQQLGYPVEWHVYAMQHNVCTAEIQDMAQWLIARFK